MRDNEVCFAVTLTFTVHDAIQTCQVGMQLNGATAAVVLRIHHKDVCVPYGGTKEKCAP